MEAKKYKIKFYKNPPTDMSVVEEELETTETKERLLQHFHIIEVVELSKDDKKSEEKVAAKPKKK